MQFIGIYSFNSPNLRAETAIILSVYIRKPRIRKFKLLAQVTQFASSNVHIQRWYDRKIIYFSLWIILRISSIEVTHANLIPKEHGSRTDLVSYTGWWVVFFFLYKSTFYGRLGKHHSGAAVPFTSLGTLTAGGKELSSMWFCLLWHVGPKQHLKAPNDAKKCGISKFLILILTWVVQPAI